MKSMYLPNSILVLVANCLNGRDHTHPPFLDTLYILHVLTKCMTTIRVPLP